MDIDLLSKMVKELVMDNDKVSLPGLGTFVAETVPATFSDKGYTVNPPYRKLSFRPTNVEDSLLIDLYAEANHVSHEIAETALVTFIDGLREVLQTRKNVIFPGLGRLRATKENNFFFVADEDLDIYPEGFGLAPLSLKTHVETKEEVSAAIDALKTMMSIDELAKENADMSVDMDAATDADADVTTTCDADTGAVSGAVTATDVVEGTAVDVVTDAATNVGAGENEVAVNRKPVWIKVMIGMLAVLLVLASLVIIYMIVARVFPDFVDSILYNPDDYDILQRF